MVARAHGVVAGPPELAQGRWSEELAGGNRINLPFLRIQERRWLLGAVDCGLVMLGMICCYDAWRWIVHPAADNMAATPWAWVVGGAGVWLSVSWLAGAYELDIADRLGAAARTTAVVWFFSAITALAAYSLFLKTYPRPALGVAMLCVPVAILVWRTVYATGLRRPAAAVRLLLIGDARTHAALLEATQARGDYFRIVALYALEPVATEAQRASVGLWPSRASGADSPCCDLDAGSTEAALPATARPHDPILDAIERNRVHRVVVASGLELSNPVVEALSSAVQRGIEVVDFNSTYEEITGKVPVEHVGNQWLGALPMRPGTSSLEEVAMRALDVVGSVAGLALTILLLPILAPAIALASGAAPIYAQRRVGRGGKVFTIYKFRSMRSDAEVGGAAWAVPNDRRVTAVGRLLRTTHLDELPQCWNVLKGDMSLVGPRPERPEFIDLLCRQIPFYRLRLSVRPGLTGLKQIRVGYAAGPEEHLEVLRHDLYYMKHRSLALNVVIIARTIGAVVGRTGR